MRTIKFRAWDKTIPATLSKDMKDKPTGKMIDWDYVSKADLNGEFPVMQFTGLLDKNGKEIYEGDIVKGRSRDPRKSYIGRVHFDSIYGSWCVHGYDNEFFHNKFQLSIPLGECRFDIEVIGNIYEHPELLENKA